METPLLDALRAIGAREWVSLGEGLLRIALIVIAAWTVTAGGNRMIRAMMVRGRAEAGSRTRVQRAWPPRHGPITRSAGPFTPNPEGTEMNAITVEPHKPETARLEDVPEPDVHHGSVLVEAIAVGVCGTDVEIVEGKYGWAPRGKTRLVLGHESLGRVVDPGPTGGLKKGDLVVGHRPSSRPGSLSQLRGGRMGHVPQRPVHRARHQGDRRLHVRALADRARVRHEGRPLARPPGRAARAHDSRDQGVGAGRRGRPTCLLGAADRARDRCRTDRSSCGPRRKAARARGPRPGPGRIGVQAGARSRPGGDLSHRHRRGRRASSRT